MAHKKAAGKTKNGRDSNPKYLGWKLQDGTLVKTGGIIVRQRGSKVLAGTGVGMGKDHTLFALRNGKVKVTTVRKLHFDNTTMSKKMASVF